MQAKPVYNRISEKGGREVGMHLGKGKVGYFRLGMNINDKCICTLNLSHHLDKKTNA